MSITPVVIFFVQVNFDLALSIFQVFMTFSMTTYNFPIQIFG